MGSRLAGRGSLALAKILIDVIRNGRPVVTVVGFLLGIALGSLTAFYSMYLFGPALGIGAIAGPVIAAALFPKPPQARGDRENKALIGKVLQYWVMQRPGVNGIGGVALMKHAIYSVNGLRFPWQQVLDQLDDGIRPDLPECRTIPLWGIERIEIASTRPSADCHGIDLHYLKRGRRSITRLNLRPNLSATLFWPALNSW